MEGQRKEAGRANRVVLQILKAIGYFAIYFGFQFAVTFVFMIVIAFGAVGAGSLSDMMDQMMSRTLANTNLIMVLSGLLTLLIYFIIFRARGKSPLREVGIEKIRSVKLMPVVIMGVALNFFVSYLMDILPIPASVVQDYVRQSSMLDVGSIWMQFSSIVVVAPVLEEIVFRGLVYLRLKRAMPVWLALLLQATLFGVMHGQIIWICYAFLLGLLLGGLFEHTGSLIANIALHVAFNAASFLVAIWNFGSGSHIAVICVSGIICLGMGILIWKYCGHDKTSGPAEIQEAARVNTPWDTGY